jgi:hypothetical protein
MSEKKGQIKAGLETNVLPETNFKKERINFIKFVNKKFRWLESLNLAMDYICVTFVYLID